MPGTNTASLIFGVLFGAVGMGHIVYGKRRQRGIALLITLDADDIVQKVDLIEE